MFLKSSTTFLLGTVLSLLILTLFNYRNFNIKVLISYLIIIFLFSYILVTNKECSLDLYQSMVKYLQYN